MNGTDPGRRRSSQGRLADDLFVREVGKPGYGPAVEHRFDRGVVFLNHESDLQVAPESVKPTLAAESALLHTAERAGGIESVVGVQPDHAGLKFAGDFEDLASLVGPDAGGESETRVVGSADRLFGRSETHDRKHRSEDLLRGR